MKAADILGSEKMNHTLSSEKLGKENGKKNDKGTKIAKTEVTKEWKIFFQ